jgi:hypothetical protein
LNAFTHHETGRMSAFPSSAGEDWVNAARKREGEQGEMNAGETTKESKLRAESGAAQVETT